MSNTEAQLFEVFSSIQGEGIHIGQRQIFIRFLMCNMSCAYCDSQESLVPQRSFRVEDTPGKRDYKMFNNPATIQQISEFIDQFNKQKNLHHSVSLTGGEPLLQIDFIKTLVPKLKEKNLKVYLETNGTMPERLSEIINLIDIVAMDIKLPSVTGASDRLAEHKKVLEIAKQKDVFVKVVCGKDSKPLEIESAAKAVEEIDSSIPFILQPVTPTKTIKHGPSAEQILLFQAIAKRRLIDVRIIPQVHKLLGQL